MSEPVFHRPLTEGEIPGHDCDMNPGEWHDDFTAPDTERWWESGR